MLITFNCKHFTASFLLSYQFHQCSSIFVTVRHEHSTRTSNSAITENFKYVIITYIICRYIYIIIYIWCNRPHFPVMNLLKKYVLSINSVPRSVF